MTWVVQLVHFRSPYFSRKIWHVNPGNAFVNVHYIEMCTITRCYWKGCFITQTLRCPDAGVSPLSYLRVPVHGPQEIPGLHPFWPVHGTDARQGNTPFLYHAPFNWSVLPIVEWVTACFWHSKNRELHMDSDFQNAFNSQGPIRFIIHELLCLIYQFSKEFRIVFHILSLLFGGHPKKKQCYKQ